MKRILDTKVSSKGFEFIVYDKASRRTHRLQTKSSSKVKAAMPSGLRLACLFVEPGGVEETRTNDAIIKELKEREAKDKDMKTCNDHNRRPPNELFGDVLVLVFV